MKVETTWGTIQIDLLDGKVSGCSLPFLSGPPEVPFAVIKNNQASAFVTALLAGKKAKPPALAKLHGTDFQQQVWKGIAAIPFGQTKTYSELAQAMGRPNAVRAVGSACGKNPVPLFIPCHRIVGSNGGLGGFSCGLPWKELLLSLEKSR